MNRKGFFDTDLFDASNMPEDAIEIGIEAYNELFAGQTAGKVISWDGSEPYLSDRVKSDEEMALSVREQRNEDLKSSDWTQLPDVPDSVKTAWSVYRQALRDVPQQEGFPHNTQWPTKPQ